VSPEDLFKENNKGEYLHSKKRNSKKKQVLRGKTSLWWGTGGFKGMPWRPWPPWNLKFPNIL